ncbi:hypothetical protein Z042_15630 [Chania multitudinisentens RB-25]|uniref:Uncharacterized protein n=1 Tax=Chania multitudinisentens RB-25 TaxID=1441930 RepID=W0LLF6_9GAMM|nr:hypothetical protein Z042_15630 [Chania multitudinisentens RB-25]
MPPAGNVRLSAPEGRNTFKCLHDSADVMTQSVGWYLACAMSLQEAEKRNKIYFCEMACIFEIEFLFF